MTSGFRPEIAGLRAIAVVSVVPVTLGILHVLRLLDRGEGGAPEDLVFRDRVLQILGVMWVAFFAAGVYG